MVILWAWRTRWLIQSTPDKGRRPREDGAKLGFEC